MADTSPVPALTRANLIFRRLLAAPWPLGISELSRDLDLSKSTVHGLVHSLVGLGLLEWAPGTGRRLRPAAALMDIWREALLKGELARASSSLLAAFSDRHNLTALAGVFLHENVLIVEAVLAPGFSVAAYVGQMVPARAAALGKILAAAPSSTRRTVQRLAEGSPLGRKAYEAEVDEVRRTGAAADREEYLRGVRALAAAVPPADQFDPLGAVWTVGLAPAMNDERLAALAPELKSLAEEISRRTAELRGARRSRRLS